MNQSRIHTVLLALACAELLFLALRGDPEPYLPETGPSMAGVEQRLDGILEEVRRGRSLVGENESAKPTALRSPLAGSDLARRLRSLDQSLAQVVQRAARTARFGTLPTPKPVLEQNHAAWIKFKKGISEDGLTLTDGARFNFMTYEEFLAAFGRPSYITAGHNGPMWVYERTVADDELQNYGYHVQFVDGIVTRVQ